MAAKTATKNASSIQSSKKAPKLQAVHKELAELYPDAKCELDHQNAFELLVATVLSAQTTDVRVNQITPQLFSNWPDAESLASAELEAVQKIVHPLGMGKRRAEQIIGLSQKLLTEHAGEVPDGQAALEALPGVGRKTAHVVRGTWFGHSLLTVDTHVGRLAKRLGWSEQQSPLAIEKDVTSLPGATEVNFTQLSHELVLHGRRVCMARKPNCEICPLECPQIGVK